MFPFKLNKKVSLIYFATCSKGEEREWVFVFGCVGVGDSVGGCVNVGECVNVVCGCV